MTQTLITAKQVAFIKRLATERDITALPDDRYTVLATVISERPVTAREASDLIGTLLRTPKVEDAHTPAATAITEAGFYLFSGDVFRVKRTKDGERLYAQRMVITGTTGKWSYEPGLINRIRGAESLTVEQAAKLGHHYGVCVICGRELSDPASVAAGIGPVCAKKLTR